jgi:hypothetical protein
LNKIPQWRGIKKLYICRNKSKWMGLFCVG